MMTNEEALEIITNAIQTDKITAEQDIALALAQKALEKQIPKKPDTKITNRGIDITGEYDIDSDYLCPICKCVVGDCEIEEYWYKYCPECGQALNWSEE